VTYCVIGSSIGAIVPLSMLALGGVLTGFTELLACGGVTDFLGGGLAAAIKYKFKIYFSLQPIIHSFEYNQT